MARTHRPPSISLSNDVLSWLLSRGLTQADVARMLGVSAGYISLVKARERALTLDHLSAVADTLGLPLGAMMLQVTPPPANMSPEAARLFEVTERLIRKTDEARASVAAHAKGESAAKKAG